MKEAVIRQPVYGTLTMAPDRCGLVSARRTLAKRGAEQATSFAREVA